MFTECRERTDSALVFPTGSHGFKSQPRHPVTWGNFYKYPNPYCDCSWDQSEISYFHTLSKHYSLIILHVDAMWSKWLRTSLNKRWTEQHLHQRFTPFDRTWRPAQRTPRFATCVLPSDVSKWLFLLPPYIFTVIYLWRCLKQYEILNLWRWMNVWGVGLLGPCTATYSGLLCLIYGDNDYNNKTFPNGLRSSADSYNKKIKKNLKNNQDTVPFLNWYKFSFHKCDK
jgi:hypothetical protein